MTSLITISTIIKTATTALFAAVPLATSRVPIGIGVVIYVLIVLIPFFIVWGVRVNKRKFRIGFVENTMGVIAREFFPYGVFYAHTRERDCLNTFADTGLIRRADFESLSAYLRANDQSGIESFTLDCSELHHGYNRAHTRGNIMRDCFEGSLLRFSMNTGIEGNVKIVSSKPVDTNFFSSTKLYFPRYVERATQATPYLYCTGDPAFDSAFDVYGNDEKSCRTIMTPVVMSKLVNLKNQHGDYSMVITRDMVQIVFAKRNYLIPVPNNKSEAGPDPSDHARQLFYRFLAMKNEIEFAVSR